MRARIFLFLSAYCLIAEALYAQAPKYTLRDLGEFQNTHVVAINNRGQLVGYTDISGQYHSFRTAPNATINWSTDDLDSLGGTDTVAASVNLSGQVTGWSLTGTGQQRAFRTAPDAAINPNTDDLGTLGGAQSRALGINDSGRVTGVSDTATGAAAFLTAPNKPIDPATDNIAVLAKVQYSTLGRGVDNSGQVTGECHFCSPSFPYPNAVAFLYKDGNITVIPTIVRAPFVDFANANDQGQIAYTDGNKLYVSQNGTATVLANCLCLPSKINNASQIVGWMEAQPNIPQSDFLYSNGTLYRFADIITNNSGWSFIGRNLTMNDLGQIAGIATLNGESHGFRLDPVGIVEHEISGMIDRLSTFGLNHGLTTSLAAKLTAAVESQNRGDSHAARNQLNAFENQVRAQSGKALTTDQANYFLEEAEEAIHLL